MLTASDIAGRHALMPDTKSVTYYVLASTGSFASGVAVDGAEKRPLGYREFNSPSLMVTTHHRLWFLWTEKLAGIVPKPGDKLTDPDSVVWYVEEGGVSQELLDQRWRLLCKRAK